MGHYFLDTQYKAEHHELSVQESEVEEGEGYEDMD